MISLLEKCQTLTQKGPGTFPPPQKKKEFVKIGVVGLVTANLVQKLCAKKKQWKIK